MASILLLEDDDSMRETLVMLLEDEGYEVTAAGSGLEAVEHVSRRSFDLMITDIRMAGMDGLEALARVKESLPDVGSLVITAYAGEADSIRALRLGAGDYLKKPFELSDLLRSVERILATRSVELAKRARMQVLRQLALGGLEALALQHGREEGRVVERLALALGFDDERREESRLAALLLALREVPGVPSILSVATRAPGVHRIIRDVESGLEPLSVEARAVIAALARSAGGDWVEAVAARTSAAVDDRLREALETVGRQLDGDLEEEGEVSGAGRARQLLSLGCALEEVGDRAAAERAFRGVAEHAPVSREAIDARLGEARLAASSGDLAAVAAHLAEAESLGRRVGPAALGHARLEAGLLWTRLQNEEAAGPALREAIEVLESLRIRPGPSLARLALADPGDPGEMAEALTVLSRPEYAAQMLSAARWLFPRLARVQARHPHPAVERALARMVREVPREVAAVLERGVADVDARRTAAAVMVAEGRPPLIWAPSLAHDSDAEVRRIALGGGRAGDEKEAPPLLRIYALGPFEVWIGEERVAESAWVSSKNKLLLALLAASGGADVPEDTLIERLWPGDPERGRRSLYNAKAVLSRCLRDGESEMRRVVRQGGMLRLDRGAPWWHDVGDLERLSSEGHRLLTAGRVADALDPFRQMAQLYRGPYMEGCTMDWALEYRTRLERLVTVALEHLVENALGCQRLHEAMEQAQRILEIDPCHQEAHLALMRGYLQGGQPEQAVRQFDLCRRRLRADLEMEPSIALVEACQRARLSL
jgi:two-component SAPR family response regulator